MIIPRSLILILRRRVVVSAGLLYHLAHRNPVYSFSSVYKYAN